MLHQYSSRPTYSWATGDPDCRKIENCVLLNLAPITILTAAEMKMAEQDLTKLVANLMK